MRVFFLLSGLIFGCGPALFGASGSYQLSVPEFSAVGRPIPVQISGTEPLSISRLPEISGARWQSARKQMVRTVNGETSYTTVFFLIPERQGRIIIPAKAFSVDGKTFPEKAAVVEVTQNAGTPQEEPDNGSIPVSKAVFGRIQLPDRADFYAGEEFRMVYQLFIRDGVRVQNIGYPNPAGVNDLAFANLSPLPDNRARRRDPRFDTPFTREEFVKGERFQVVNFISFCRGVRPGTIHPGGSLSLQLVQESHSENDFFGGFFGHRELIPHTVEFAGSVPVTIHPLPPPPAEGFFSGLVGAWQLDAKLEPASAAAGEPVELILTAQGEGSGESFRIPELSFPGFRAYPPKESREFGKVTVKYVLVPLKAGESALNFAISVFDSKSKEYRLRRFALTLPVRPGTITPGTASAAPEPIRTEEQSSAVPRKKTTPGEELNYLKAGRGLPVLTPLAENQGWLLRGLLYLGPVLGLALFGCLSYRKRRAADPSFGRKRERRKALPGLLKALKNDPSPDPETRRQILDLLADALSLPPGASSAEIGAAAARRTNDPEARQAVEELENSGFLPGESALSGASGKKLCALLKKLCLWGLLLLPLLGSAEESYNHEYEAGNFPEAIARYRKDITSGAVHPNALYNLGGTYVRTGDLPRARLCYLRAHLLKPADSEIASNLDWVDRKLLLPPRNGEAGPTALFREYRDLLRPDQYLLAAAGIFFLLCLTLGASPLLSRKALWLTAGSLTLLFLFAAGCAFAQCRSTYRPDEAVVVSETLKLQTLPGSGGREDGSVSGGSSARILDLRGDWVRISSGGREGWAERSGLEPVFPWGLFTPEQGL